MYIYTIKFITPIYKHDKFIKNDIDIKRIKINKIYADETKALAKSRGFIITHDANRFNAHTKDNSVRISITPYKKYWYVKHLTNKLGALTLFIKLWTFYVLCMRDLWTSLCAISLKVFNICEKNCTDWRTDKMHKKC